jgi:uncharacterized protein with FMN-binding domain
MKRKGKVFMWILIVLGVLVAAMGAGIIATEPGRRELKEMTFPATAFQGLKQGTYVGEYKGAKDSFRNEKVQVTVADGKVSGIKVLEGSVLKDGKPVEIRNGQSIDDLSGRVISSQSLHVDIISGATLNSNAHLKAVENALALAGNK